MSSLPWNPNAGTNFENSTAATDALIDSMHPDQQKMYDGLIRYMAYDPGLNTGLTTFNRHGQVLNSTVFRYPELTKMIGAFINAHITWKASPGIMSGWFLTIIYEDYFLRPDKLREQIGSKMEVARAIGQIELLASATMANLVCQPFHILRSTAAHHGIKIPPEPQHIPDDKVSLLHGLYYLEKIGKAKIQLPKPDKYDL